jgi:membrane protein implicated in regulation of membrane protease activity
MALTVAIVLALVFLPWPWNLLMILGGLLIETGELAWGLSLARRWKPKTGGEAMIGIEARVVSACRPLGEVRVQGELWRARCDDGADIGEQVRILSIEGLTLVVARSSGARQETQGSSPA